MLNLRFIPTSLEKCLQNAFVNYGSQPYIITLGNPWCLNHLLRKGYAVSNAVAVPTMGTMCANLEKPFYHQQNGIIPMWLLQTCDQVHVHTMPWTHWDKQRLQEARFTWHFIQAFTKWAISSFMHRQWYILNTILWQFVFLLYGRLWLSYLSFKTDSLNLLCGIYIWIFLYLNNPFTNLTSSSTLLLQS